MHIFGDVVHRRSKTGGPLANLTEVSCALQVRNGENNGGLLGTLEGRSPTRIDVNSLASQPAREVAQSPSDIRQFFQQHIRFRIAQSGRTQSLLALAYIVYHDMHKTVLPDGSAMEGNDVDLCIA